MISGRLIYIDPTDINNSSSNNDISYPYEDYSIAVDLTVKVTDRYSCGWSLTREEYNYSSNNGTLSFLGGSKEGDEQVLTTNYTDVVSTDPSTSTSECLGIESISITYNSWLYPQVVIKFVDVRGATVMTPSEYSYNGETEIGVSSKLYKSLFTFPYPMFILKVKGIYGKSTTYKLAVETTNIEFNSATGNFEIVVKFIGYMYGIYSDLPMTYIAAAPYMEEGSIYWSEKVADGTFKFKDANGNPSEDMCTFPQLRDKLSKIAENQEEEVPAMEDEMMVESYEQQITFLNELIDDYPFNKDDWEEKTVNGTTFSMKILYDEIALRSECDNIATYYNKLKNYQNNKGGYIPNIFSRCKNEEEFKEVLMSLAKVKLLSSDGIITNMECNKDIPETVKNAIKEVIKGTKSKRDSFLLFNQYIVNDKNIHESLRNEKNAIKAKKTEREKKVLSKKAIEIEKILGFKPSIRNVYELIFAHIDTFMHCFFKQTKNIETQLKESDGKRDIEQYGLSYDNIDVDSKKNKLPPYFAYYGEEGNGAENNGNKRKVFKWIGELPGGSDLEEVKFILDLLNSSQLYVDKTLPEDDKKSDSYEGRQKAIG